jgi:hypothetical protein
MQPAFLAHREEERDRRMRQVVLEERLDQRHEQRAARPVVAAERGGAVAHDPVALAPGLGAGAERHGVEVGGEQEPRPGPGAGQVDDQVAGLGRQGDARGHVVEADRGGRHAERDEIVADRLGDGLLLARHAFDGEVAQQVGLGRGDVEVAAGVAHGRLL